MRSKSGLFLGLLLFCLTALLFFTVALPQPVSAERVLTSARDQLIAPQPGQIVELSSTIWRRPPPARLELSDPYHAPFTLLWPVLQEETRWIELDADGNMIRWRTQLRNEAGQLQQELLFVDGIETVFSARDQHLDSYPSQIFPFHDQRQVLIDAFLQESTLQQEDAFDWEGKPVTAVSVVYDQKQWRHPEIPQQPEKALTDVELQLLRQLPTEQTQVSMAQSLGLSDRMVRYHLQAIYDKLEVKSSLGAAVMAIRLGLM